MLLHSFNTKPLIIVDKPERVTLRCHSSTKTVNYVSLNPLTALCPYQQASARWNLKKLVLLLALVAGMSFGVGLYGSKSPCSFDPSRNCSAVDFCIVVPNWEHFERILDMSISVVEWPATAFHSVFREKSCFPKGRTELIMEHFELSENDQKHPPHSSREGNYEVDLGRQVHVCCQRGELSNRTDDLRLFQPLPRSDPPKPCESRSMRPRLHAKIRKQRSI